MQKRIELHEMRDDIEALFQKVQKAQRRQAKGASIND